MSNKTYSLDVVRVANSCHESWDAMHGDAGQRFCDSCAKHVHNLSAMTRSQAEAFINEHPTGVCIRMYKDASGRVITADDPPTTRHGQSGGPRRRAAHVWLPWLTMLAAGAGSVMVYLGLNQRSGSASGVMGEAPPIANPQSAANTPNQPPTRGTTPSTTTNPPPGPSILAPIPQQAPPDQPPVEALGEIEMIMGDVAMPEPVVMGKIAAPGLVVPPAPAE